MKILIFKVDANIDTDKILRIKNKIVNYTGIPSELCTQSFSYGEIFETYTAKENLQFSFQEIGTEVSKAYIFALKKTQWAKHIISKIRNFCSEEEVSYFREITIPEKEEDLFQQLSFKYKESDLVYKWESESQENSLEIRLSTNLNNELPPHKIFIIERLNVIRIEAFMGDMTYAKYFLLGERENLKKIKKEIKKLYPKEK
jgi:hypothetical protein